MAKLKVKESDLMEGIEFQSDDMQVYLNTKTGEVVYVTEEDSMAVDNDIEEYPEWQRESIEVAEEVMYEDYFEPLSSKDEINEYQMMEVFSLSMADKNIRESLLRAISGRGAFRRFKDEIFKYGVREEWFTYKEERLKNIIVKWCEHLDLELVE